MSKEDTRPDITKELLQEYVKNGYSQERIAVDLETTRVMISHKMKKYGVTPGRIRVSKYDEKTLIKQLQNGWTTEQMARYFEVSEGTISYWIKKNGLGMYRKAPVRKQEIANCRTCIYRSHEKTALNKCNYLIMTGHSRNKGQPETVCSKYVKGGRKRVRKRIRL